MFLLILTGFPVAQTVKTLPAMQDTQVRFLSWKDPLEREWLSPPAFLLGEFHEQRRLVGYSLWDHRESDTTEKLSTS